MHHTLTKRLMSMSKNRLSKMKRLELSLLGQQSVELFHQLAEIWIFHKHIASVKENQIIIYIRVDNMIHHIINFNLLFTDNVNIIVIIE